MRRCYLTIPLKKADGLSRLDMLEQDKWWADQHGRVRLTRNLDRMHRLNLLVWLMRESPRLRVLVIQQDLLAALVYEELDFEGVEELRATAREWMAERPLFKALLVQAAE